MTLSDDPLLGGTLSEGQGGDWVLGNDILPHDDDAILPEQVLPVLGDGDFRYIGQGLTADGFTAYVRDYNFGSIPPNFLVLHHTATPGATWAVSTGNPAALWDAGEQGLSEDAIMQQRKGRLDGIMRFYRTTYPTWPAGPHLFVDDRYIWLFSPMNDWGVHAKEGNGSGNSYSIGIEVVGDYTNVVWPEPVANLVGHAVAVLKQRLGTFELRYQRMAGGISSHRDYNKPACPGNAISNDFYLDAINRAYQRLTGGGTISVMQAQPAPAAPSVVASPITADSPLLGPDSGGVERCVAFIHKRPQATEYNNDVETIMGYYWKYAPAVGLDPFIAACQCIFETDALTSQWAARPRRNPAGLGVRQEGGLSFDTWENAVQAHLGQLLAFALTDAEANDAQRAMMARNPRHANIPAQLRGAAKTIAGLNGRWTDNSDYATGLVNRIASVQQAL